MNVRICLAAILFSWSAVALASQVADPPKSFSGLAEYAGSSMIRVTHEKKSHTVRISGIVPPEWGQVHDHYTKTALAKMLKGKEVKVVWTKRNKEKEIIAEVFLAEKNIGLEIVRSGLAWHDSQNIKDATLAKAEKEARAAKRGLWASGATPVAPWDFRRGIKPPTAIEVFVTNSGEKYHWNECQFLTKSRIPISLAAVQGKHGPCSVCGPPTIK